MMEFPAIDANSARLCGIIVLGFGAAHFGAVIAMRHMLEYVSRCGFALFIRWAFPSSASPRWF
jgi:undecaprenyl pyrophosphate phosphatase UppP